MNELSEFSIACPYCGEVIDVLVDSAEAEQEYTEDCQVCCRPIVFSVHIADDGELQLTARSEDDTF